MRTFLSILFSLILSSQQAQTTFSVCAGATITLTAVNSQTWINPSYTLYPDNTSNTSGSFVVTPSASGNYTIVLAGIGPNQQVQSQSTVYSVTVQSPVVSISGPSLVTCTVPQITLSAHSGNNSLVYSWLSSGSGSPKTGPTLAVNSLTASPTLSLAGVFTLQAQGSGNNCSSTQTVLVAQSLFKPIGAISPANNLSLSCHSPTLLVTNQSSTGIPKNGMFPTTLPVVAQSWTGPGTPSLNSQSYVVAVPGIYTLTVMDMNNGCTSEKTFLVNDNLKFAMVNNPVTPPPANLCGNATVLLMPIINTTTAGLTFTWSSPANAVVSGVNSQNLQTNLPGIYTLQVTYTSSGCVTQVTMSAEYCVGMSANPLFKDVSVFPNPATNHITVSGLLQGTYTYLITDISGRTIRSGSFVSHELSIETSLLSPGIYFLHLTDSRGLSETRKIVKE